MDPRGRHAERAGRRRGTDLVPEHATAAATSRDPGRGSALRGARWLWRHDSASSHELRHHRRCHRVVPAEPDALLRRDDNWKHDDHGALHLRRRGAPVQRPPLRLRSGCRRDDRVRRLWPANASMGSPSRSRSSRTRSCWRSSRTGSRPTPTRSPTCLLSITWRLTYNPSFRACVLPSDPAGRVGVAGRPSSSSRSSLDDECW